MDAKAKARWIADLRSGKFTQARECFVEQDTEGLCCLSVLATQAPERFKIVRKRGELRSLVNPFAGLKEGLKEVFGLSSEQFTDAVSMNDHRCYTFAEIADVVESWD